MHLRAIATVLSAAVCLVLTEGAGAQAPSAAQQDAIRSNCRSDFLSLCSGVPRGGREAFECLAKNTPRLSSACRNAVTAVAPPASPAPAPATAAPAPAAPVRAAPSTEKPAAIESRTPPAAAAPAPTVSAPAAPPPVQPAAKADRPPKAPAAKSVATPARPAAPAAPSVAAPAAATPPAAAPAAPRPPKLGEAAIVRRFCFNDFRVLCKGVQLGQGRALKCLADNQPALSPGCKQAMAGMGN